jgi:hypothetical protein
MLSGGTSMADDDPWDKIAKLPRRPTYNPTTQKQRDDFFDAPADDTASLEDYAKYLSRPTMPVPFNKLDNWAAKTDAETYRYRNEQMAALLTLRQQEIEAKRIAEQERRLPETLAREHELEIELHNTRIEEQKLGRDQIKAQRYLTRQAASQDMDEVTYLETRRQQEEANIRMTENRESSHLRVLEKQAESQIAIEQHRAMKEIDSAHNLNEVKERVRLSFLVDNLSSHQEIDLLIKVMDKLNREIEAIEESSRPDYIKDRMIRSRERYIAQLDEEIGGRQRKLLAAYEPEEDEEKYDEDEDDDDVKLGMRW